LEKILTNPYYVQAAVRRRMATSALAPHLDLIASELDRLGYCRRGIRRWLHAADSFGHWLVRQKLTVRDITESVTKRYLGSLRRGRCREWRDRNIRHVRCLIEFLQQRGCVPPETPHTQRIPPFNAQDACLRELKRDMEHVSGLAPATCSKYLRQVRYFLKFAFFNARPNWRRLQPEQLTRFIRRRSAKLAPGSRAEVVKPLRKLISFLVRKGKLRDGFEGVIPPIRVWKHAGVPRHISEEELERVIALCPKGSSRARRDRAMLLLLARLGLRPGELLRISLEDADWRNGTLLIRAGKTHRERRLPLPRDVAAALADYLTQGRPQTSSHRAIFLSMNPPHKPLKNPQVLSALVIGLLQKAGISVARPGAYLLRHTLATHMVQRGASFKQVADVLGHRALATTAGYAKLNLPLLAEIALPWPGGAQ
jgi:integrase/recombinase XerD